MLSKKNKVAVKIYYELDDNFKCVYDVGWEKERGRERCRVMDRPTDHVDVTKRLFIRVNLIYSVKPIDVWVMVYFSNFIAQYISQS